MSKLALMLFAPLAMVSLVAWSDGLGYRPGVYRGIYSVDRWGKHHFDALLVSDEAAKMLEPYRGRLVAATVTEVSQVTCPGIGTIQAIEKVEPLSSISPLGLSITAKSTEFKQGTPVKLTVRIENNSQKPLLVLPGRDFANLFVAASFVDANPDMRLIQRKPGSGTWISEEVRSNNGKFHRNALLALLLRWSAEDFVSHGRGIKETTERPNLPERVEMEPKGRFSTDVLVDAELPPGEYEAWFSMTHTVGRRAGEHEPVSNRFAFDVTATGDDREE